MSDANAARERVQELEAENARLRSIAEVSVVKSKRTGRLRTLAAVLCISLAALLIPVGVLVSWAQSQLLDEERFIATFAPLAEHPEVQAEIVNQTTDLIDREIDIDGLTEQVFDGIAELGLPERAVAVLSLLQQPAADGVRAIIDRGVTEFVASDAFAATWEQALRMSHRAFVAAATSSDASDQVLTIGDDGIIAIQLGPILAAVQDALEDRGFGLASAIPAIEASITVASTDALPTLRLIVTLTAIVGWWLPIIIFALLVGGVALAPRRSRAVAGAGVGLILGAGLVLILFEIAATILTLQAPSLGVGAEAVAVFFAQIVSAMRAQAVTILIIGVLLWIAGWIMGTSRLAVATRRQVRRASLATKQQLARANAGLRARMSERQTQVPTESTTAPETINGDDSRTAQP